MKAIVYASQTGFTQRYAKLLSEKTGVPAGISRAAAYELVRSKGFPRMKIGTRILVPRDKFLAWIDEQTEVEE